MHPEPSLTIGLVPLRFATHSKPTTPPTGAFPGELNRRKMAALPLTQEGVK
jgi:hypothetical protein